MASQVYGGTRALLRDELGPRGLGVVEFDVARPADLEELGQVSAVIVESLSNPNLLVADLPRLVAVCRASGATLIVDATFATPVLQRPLSLGADLVVHSATKALGGHSDLSAGVVAGGGELLGRARDVRRRLGAVLDPAPASLLERGLKTLALRVRAQVEGATALARALEAHPKVRAVHYPGLESHPDYERAGELLSGAGGVLSFEHVDGDAALRPLTGRLELAIDAPSLGGVETLVSLPAFMSHAGLDEQELRRAGVVPGLVRVSVGIEDPDDLVRDFERALGG